MLILSGGPVRWKSLGLIVAGVGSGGPRLEGGMITDGEGRPEDASTRFLALPCHDWREGTQPRGAYLIRSRHKGFARGGGRAPPESEDHAWVPLS